LKNPRKIQDYILEQFEEETNVRLSNMPYYDHKRIRFNYIEIT